MNAYNVGGARFIDDRFSFFNGILPSRADLSFYASHIITLMTRTSWPGRMELSFFNDERPLILSVCSVSMVTNLD